ncbi:hypothetical protein [Streptococcus equi]
MFKWGYAISIHSPVWGETEAHAIVVDMIIFQSTRPYGARQKLLLI